MRKNIKKLGVILLIVILVPLQIPQNLEMPVLGATNADFNPYAHLDEIRTSAFKPYQIFGIKRTH